MNSSQVKRIVALTRRIKGYKALVNTGDLTQTEADIAIAECKRELTALRSQDDLQLEPGGKAAPKTGKPA